MASILIVEDDVDIAQGLAEFLEAKGHKLDFAYNGKQALQLVSENAYELVLLDLNLPFVDGLDVCRSLLQDQLTQVPVIIMSARAEETDVLLGFDCGAWDYLVKPFSFAELSARISVCLARSTHTHSLSSDISVGEAILKCENKSFVFNGKSLQLYQVGFDFMKLLMTKAPSAVLTSHIHQVLWQDATPESDPLRAHVYKLRKQFQETFEHEFITTVRGIGYKFTLKK